MNNKSDVLVFPFSKYTDYFHDGHITHIEHKKNNIELWMESAELRPEWNEDNIPLSKRNTITGKLLLQKIKSIYEYEHKFLKKLQFYPPYEKANIFHFCIKENRVTFELLWVQYFPDFEESDIYEYNIEAGEIIWENDPTLIDSWWEFDDEA